MTRIKPNKEVIGFHIFTYKVRNQKSRKRVKLPLSSSIIAFPRQRRCLARQEASNLSDKKTSPKILIKNIIEQFDDVCKLRHSR